MGSLEGEIPFWNVNIPESQHTPDCPPFLAVLAQKDRDIIGTLDAQHHVQTWSDVQRLAATNRLDLFERKPSDLRRYHEYNWGLKQEYGSVLKFILTERLFWEEPLKAKAAPFKDPSDLKILCNDWPYGIDPSILHLVVWTKFELQADPITDDVTDRTRKEIDEFVREKFYKRMGEDNVRLNLLFPLPFQRAIFHSYYLWCAGRRAYGAISRSFGSRTGKL